MKRKSKGPKVTGANREESIETGVPLCGTYGLTYDYELGYNLIHNDRVLQQSHHSYAHTTPFIPSRIRS